MLFFIPIEIKYQYIPTQKKMIKPKTRMHIDKMIHRLLLIIYLAHKYLLCTYSHDNTYNNILCVPILYIRTNNNNASLKSYKVDY